MMTWLTNIINTSVQVAAELWLKLKYSVIYYEYLWVNIDFVNMSNIINNDITKTKLSWSSITILQIAVSLISKNLNENWDYQHLL